MNRRWLLSWDQAGVDKGQGKRENTIASLVRIDIAASLYAMRMG